MQWRIEDHLSADTYQHLVRISETLTLSEGKVLIREGGLIALCLSWNRALWVCRKRQVMANSNWAP